MEAMRHKLVVYTMSQDHIAEVVLHQHVVEVM